MNKNCKEYPEALKRAILFVRTCLEERGQRIEDHEIKEVAEKVVKALPPYGP